MKNVEILKIIFNFFPTKNLRTENCKTKLNKKTKMGIEERDFFFNLRKGGWGAPTQVGDAERGRRWKT